MDNNKVVVAGQQNPLAAIVPALFKDVDFNGLNATIDELAKNNKELDDKGKEMAVQVVNQWESTVIGRLYARNQEMNNFMNFFELTYGRYYNETLPEDKQYDLAVKTNTVKEYEAYIAAKEALETLQQTRPEEPIEDVQDTFEARFLAQKEYELAISKYDIAVQRAQRVVSNCERVWKNLVKENADIKQLITKAKSYTRNLQKLIDECKSKGDMAKLSVTISSETIRAALKELLAFTDEI